MAGAFEVGDIVVDDARKRVGQIMDIAHFVVRGRVLVLRPPQGGTEWDAQASKCRRPEPGEIVSAKSLKYVESP